MGKTKTGKVILEMVGRNYHVPLRTFGKGATRNTEEGKVDYEGHLSPLVIEWYGKFCDTHRRQPDGTLRPSDNWQLGIPLESYMESGWRHFLDWWLGHRGHKTRDETLAALGSLLFNVQGYAHELLREKP